MDTSAARIDRASCLVCGDTRRAQRFVQRGYPVCRCLGCGLEFVTPIPSAEELAEYYDQGYAVPLEGYAAAGQRNVARIADLERRSGFRWRSRASAAGKWPVSSFPRQRRSTHAAISG
jgi:hypothetical protein